MNVRKLISSAGIALVLAAGATALTALPASATDCPSGKSCTWRDAGYVTASHSEYYLSFTTALYDFAGDYYANIGGTYYYYANDSASSVYNNGNVCSVGYYKDAGYGTRRFIIPKKAGDSDLNNASGYGGYNDELSSGQFIC